jgi:hypothetical protein
MQVSTVFRRCTPHTFNTCDKAGIATVEDVGGTGSDCVDAAWAELLSGHLPGAMRTSAPDISVDTGNTDTSALLM